MEGCGGLNNRLRGIQGDDRRQDSRMHVLQLFGLVSVLTDWTMMSNCWERCCKHIQLLVLLCAWPLCR